jgi:protein-L-isoaspartate O-methyltransferase
MVIAMHTNMNQVAHDRLRRHLHQDSVCLDATCGNGHDTLFLARLTREVHAIDIQEHAIEATRTRIQDAGFDHVRFHLMSHSQLVQIFGDSPMFDAIVYNLGYLPHSDHTVITRPDTTVASLQQALPLLKQGGLLSVMVYTGHEGGQAEADAVEDWFSRLDKHEYTVQKTCFLNRKNGPYLIVLEKLK